MEFDFLA